MKKKREPKPAKKKTVKQLEQDLAIVWHMYDIRSKAYYNCKVVRRDLEAKLGYIRAMSFWVCFSL